MVIGIGNPILTDDGIGIKIVEFLRERKEYGKYRFITESVGGLEILERIEGYDTVIFIDAIKTRGGTPGDVYFLGLDDFKETLHLSNLHDVSFLTAIELGRRLGLHIPRKIHVLAIEILEDMVFSNEFSAPLQDRFDEILEKITGWFDGFT